MSRDDSYTKVRNGKHEPTAVEELRSTLDRFGKMVDRLVACQSTYAQMIERQRRSNKHVRSNPDHR